MRMQRSTALVFLTALVLLATALPAAAQFDYTRIGIDVTGPEETVAPGGSGEITIVLDVPFGFTLTDNVGVFGIAPLEDMPNVTFGELVKPEYEKVDSVGGHFGGLATFTLPFTLDPSIEPGDLKITLGFTMQACDDMTGICYLPTNPSDYTAAALIEVAGEPVQSGSGTSEGAAMADGAETGSSGNSLEDLFSGSLEGGNIWFALLLAVGAGILTSLTPCVYPMIPITISYVSGKAQGQKRNGFFISLVLVLGIAITYSVLGLLAAMTGATFGSYINHPIVQAILFVVLVAMGFSMLGVWEISMPQSMQQKMSTQKTGYGGALFVGLTIGFVAAPCVAPILVIMLTWIATTQNMLIGFVLMFAYAIGMGILFVIVGTFSNAILPKSGMWMEWLKKIFAFVFFIMAVFYASGLINSIYPGTSTYVIGALLVIFGTMIGAFARVETDANPWLILGKAFGLIAVVTGLLMFASTFLGGGLGFGAAGGSSGDPAFEETADFWIKDFEEGLRIAEETGKPMLLDIWATWCIACHELDEFTFSDPRVRARLEEEFVPVKIDGTTDANQAYQRVKAYYKERGESIVGLPAVFIHNADGTIAERVNSFIPAEEMLKRMDASN